jgi:hypothetical protein
MVVTLSFPVIILDEFLKLIGRRYCGMITYLVIYPSLLIPFNQGTGSFKVLTPKKLGGYNRLLNRDVELSLVKTD